MSQVCLLIVFVRLPLDSVASLGLTLLLLLLDVIAHIQTCRLDR